MNMSTEETTLSKEGDTETRANNVEISQIHDLVSAMRTDYYSQLHFPPSLDWRRQQLQQIKKMMLENKTRWEEALEKDLRSNRLLKMYEVSNCVADVDLMLDNLHKWTKPKQQPNTTATNFGANCVVYREPYGLILIISPWNYPLTLLVRPMIGAIAAGNACVLKPSEVSSTCAALFAELVPQYLDTRMVKVVTGAVPETTELLKQKWDYIFYTGNSKVGRIVQRAAAEHLTPVTLELGGKSPCIVDSNVNIDVTAKRIAWGKTLNCGQTCTTVDYLLVHRDVKDALVERIQHHMREFFGDNIQQSPDYSRIVNLQHCERLQKLLDDIPKEKIIFGGGHNVDDNYIEPTIVDEPPLDSSMMRDEIFGPILPVIAVDSIDDAILRIKQGPKPLALYIFSNSSSVVEHVLTRTSFGCGAVNDVILQTNTPTLPFGGIGESGMGRYNGSYSFETFSHEKGILKRSWMDPSIRYPPYTDKSIKMLKATMGSLASAVWSIVRMPFTNSE